MGQITFRNHYPLPPEKLFGFTNDPLNMPRYMPWISNDRDVIGPFDKVESRFTFTDTFMGRKVDGTTEIVKVEVPTLYETLTKYTNGMTVRITDRLTPAGDGTDLVTVVDYDLGAGVIAAAADRVVVGKLIEHRLRNAYDTFGVMVEAETPELITA